MKRYGLSYMGSKNFIAKGIADFLPSAENYYDPFVGGGAVLHAVLEAGKYKNYYASDLASIPVDGLKKAFAGEFKNETRWISREDFERLKFSDPYVFLCFSFGNGGKSYAYGNHIDPWKKALHYARVFNDFSLLREFGIETNKADKKDIKKHSAEYKSKYINWFCQNILHGDFESLKKELEERTAELEKIKDEQREYLCDALKKSGLRPRDVGRNLGSCMEKHYFAKSQFSFPTKENYLKMQTFMPLPRAWEECMHLENLQRLEKLQRLENLQRLESSQRLQNLESLESLQRLQSLESLESLQSLESLHLSISDYRQLEIKPHSVVYCDPPYWGTHKYLLPGKKRGEEIDFDHEAFYSWLREIAKIEDVKVFISEYEMPEGFEKVKEFKKVSVFNPNERKGKSEFLFKV